MILRFSIISSINLFIYLSHLSIYLKGRGTKRWGWLQGERQRSILHPRVHSQNGHYSWATPKPEAINSLWAFHVNGRIPSTGTICCLPSSLAESWFRVEVGTLIERHTDREMQASQAEAYPAVGSNCSHLLTAK